jgi:8-oxo-dGTP pyrophosphatase MutT (NUDIX family)
MHSIQLVCRGLITNVDGHFLFVKKVGASFWSLPGGKVDFDDLDLKVAVARELQEEIGVTAKIGDVLFVQELHKNNIRFVEFIWEANVNGATLPTRETIRLVSGGELEDIAWISNDNLEKEDARPFFLKGKSVAPVFNLIT